MDDSQTHLIDESPIGASRRHSRSHEEVELVDLQPYAAHTEHGSGARQEEVELVGVPAKMHSGNVSIARPIKAGPTTIRQRLGNRAISVLIATIIAVLAVLGFLCFLWFAPRDNAFWHTIIIRGWASGAVTISSLVLRTAVDLQAGIAVAMLAALLLETDYPIRLTDAAQILKLRAGSAVPLDLAFPFLKTLKLQPWTRLKNVLYVLAVPLLLATSIVLQFTSTILISDLSLALLPGPTTEQALLYDLTYVNNTLSGRRVNIWTLTPPVFPTFAEYSEHIRIPDLVDDTGTLFRALLPFRDAQSREMVSDYSGKAVVLDARVSCQRPQLEELMLSYYRDDFYVLHLMLNGTVSPTEVVPRLVAAQRQGRFRCSLVGGSRVLQNSMTICQVYRPQDRLLGEMWDTSNWLQQDSNPGGTSISAYLIINTTMEFRWKDGMEKQRSGHGAWTDISYLPRHSNDGSLTSLAVNVSISLCYPAFWTARTNVEIYAMNNRTEPVPQLVGERYITSPDIHDQMGEFRRPMDNATTRGILSMSRKESWRTLAEDDVNLMPLGGAYRNTPLALYFADLWSTLSALDRDPSVTWTMIDSNPQPTRDQSNAISAALASIFTSSLEITHGSAATALSTIITVITTMAYYDQMPYFKDATTGVRVTSFQPTVFPQSMRGFVITLCLTIIHCSLVLLIVVAFCACSRFSTLGDHWQSVAQLVSPETEGFLSELSYSSDKEARRLVKKKYGETRTVSIRTLDDKGRVGLVRRQVSGLSRGFVGPAALPL